VIGFFPLIFTLAGAAIYLLIYSSWLKRISPFNVVLGGFAGGAPVMGGWTAHTGTIELGAVLLAGLVVVWIPHHIWSLALYYAKEYREVSIPMLPAIVEPRLAVRCIAITVIIMYAFSLLFYYYSPLGELYLYVALIFGLAPMLYGTWLFMRPDNRRAWVLFKISSPYLAILFIVMIIDRLLA
jgi:protoheme IX farnesyltransferase